jgi:hypothetical protein
MKSVALVLLVLGTAVSAEGTPPPDCMGHGAFADRMAAAGAVITMAEVVQDGSDRRLEAYYQPEQCAWTLAIVQMKKGKISLDSRTCLLGEGDPGVCIPKK